METSVAVASCSEQVYAKINGFSRSKNRQPLAFLLYNSL